MFLQVLENAGTHSLLYASLAFLVAIWLGRRVLEEIKIRKAGGHARALRSWAPLGLDVMLEVVLNSRKYKNIETWKRWFHSPSIETLESRILNQRTIFTVDPQNIKAVLATQFQDYGKGEGFHRSWEKFLGDSIFTTDGKQWHNSRQLLRPLFQKDRIHDLEAMEKHVQKLIYVLKKEQQIPQLRGKAVGTGYKVDICDHFFRYTLDVAMDFLLGQSVNSIDNPKQAFEVAFEEVQQVQSLIARLGWLHFAINKNSFDDGLQVMNDFLSQFINRALALEPSQIREKSESDYTFLHALANFTRDPKVLRDQLAAILIAGRDTTAGALSWTFYQLARHPESFEKLRKEVIERLGEERLPTYADLREMGYLQNVISEILRLYPIIPYNVRVALKDTTLPRGGGPDGNSPVAVLEGTPIFYSPLFMQRRETYYPDGFDYLEFRPERWKNWHPAPWTYLPFNGGPRICIGQGFALTEIGYTIARLVQTFSKVENLMSGEETMKSDIVLRPAHGVHVGLWTEKDSTTGAYQ